MAMIVSDNYTVLKEFRTEFNPKQFNEKIVQVLLKYDFLVGDFADDQLRLKGFYHNKRRDTDPSKRAATIEKYIKESCNFMCPHYVLEKVKDFPERKRSNNKNRKNYKKRPRKPKQQEPQAQAKPAPS